MHVQIFEPVAGQNDIAMSCTKDVAPRVHQYLFNKGVRPVNQYDGGDRVLMVYADMSVQPILEEVKNALPDLTA